MRIERVVDAAVVHRAAHLFDHAPDPVATERFLADPTHHLLVAHEDDAGPDDPAVGFVSGVETTHPDKGTELFLYELAVDEAARRRGVATALVDALARLARERGCYGMWVATEPENAAALATYRRAGGTDEEPSVVLAWDLTEPG